MTKRAGQTAPAGPTLEGPRVVLRPLSEADLADIEPWYAEAAAATLGLSREDAPGVQNLRYRLEAASTDPSAGLVVIARRDDATPIALIDYRAGHPAPGWLTLGYIAVAPAQRGHGYGSEAVRLLEGEARRRGTAARFRADVAMNNGLGVYFWLRLGYRPARPKERPWPASPTAAVLSMVRTP